MPYASRPVETHRNPLPLFLRDGLVHVWGRLERPTPRSAGPVTELDIDRAAGPHAHDASGLGPGGSQHECGRSDRNGTYTTV